MVYLVCILAGLGAGLGTGFAGMSAAAVISPMLIVCLGVDPYEAVAIALASDVLASLVSAINYGRNKHLDLKNGAIMMVMVLLFTFLGSYIASLVETKTMGTFSLFMTVILGLRFIFKPVMTKEEKDNPLSNRSRLIKSIIFGALIGFICGFVGAGGGMMMLLVLTSILGYDLKTAVGTSVFIMTFTAFTGALSHFAIGGITEIIPLIVCIVSTLVFAQIASRIATFVKPKTLNRITGCVLVVLGISLILVHYLG